MTSTPSKTDELLQRILNTLSPVQQKFVLDQARNKLARAARRAGKSYADAALMVYTAVKFAKSPVLYFGLTEDSAKEAIWETLKECIEKCKVPCVVNDAQLTVTFLNGSVISLYGLDMKKMKDRFRGRKAKLIIIDECGFFTGLDAIVAEVLLALLMDLEGSLVMTSSPPALPVGLFWEADQGNAKKYWAQYSWNLYDNPHFQQPSKTINPATGELYASRAEEELDRVCITKFDGDRNHPGFRREFLGEWVFDKHSLVYPITPEQHFHDLPPTQAPQYALGFNLSRYGSQGYTVVRFSEYDRKVHVVEAKVVKCRTLNGLAEVLRDLNKRFKLERTVVHLGKEKPEILDDFRVRYDDIPLQASEYKKLPFYQKIVASDLEANHIFVKDTCTDLLKEMHSIVRDEDGLEIENEDLKPVVADAFFAAYLAIYNAHLKAIKKPESEEERLLNAIMDSLERDEYSI